MSITLLLRPCYTLSADIGIFIAPRCGQRENRESFNQEQVNNKAKTVGSVEKRKG